MGPKQKVTQVSNLTPLQQALMDSQIRNATTMMQGQVLGTTYGGPGTTSSQGFGGRGYGMPNGYVPAGTAPPPNPLLAALAKLRIPGSPGAPGTASAMIDPSSPAAYSNRENLVSPIVNPFRRNLGG